MNDSDVAMVLTMEGIFYQPISLSFIKLFVSFAVLIDLME